MSALRSAAAEFCARADKGFVLAGGIALLGLFAWQLTQWRFLCDDAYIALRYAQNWVDSGAAFYNPGQAGVQAFTSPLWVALTAGLYALGVPLQNAALGLNALSLLLLLAVGAGLSASWSARSSAKGSLALCALLLLLIPEFVVWGSGGLESSAAAALGMCALLAARHGRWTWVQPLAVLAALTRLDSLVWLLPALFYLARRHLWSSFFVRSSWSWLAVPALLTLQRLFYGDFFPQSFAVKSSGWTLAMSYGLSYLTQWLVAGGLAVALGVSLLGARRCAALLIVVFCNLLYAFAVGGDFMAYSRFLLPATTAAVAGCVAVSRELYVDAGPKQRRWMRWGLVLALFALLLRLGQRLEEDRRNSWIDGRYESVHAMERFAALRVAAGRAFARHWPSSTVVSVGAAGAFPFASGLRSYDVFGLSDPEVLRLGRFYPQARPGHQWVGHQRWRKARDPRLRCEVGWVDTGRPSRSELVRRSKENGARWHCQSTGPVKLRGEVEPLPSHFYCCIEREIGS